MEKLYIAPLQSNHEIERFSSLEQVTTDIAQYSARRLSELGLIDVFVLLNSSTPNKVLGYCALGEYQHKDLKTWLAVKEPAILELIAIAVIPELRGTEAGPMLMAAVTTAFYESDFNVLYLEALGSHPKLIHYYADKYGFQLLVQAGRMVLLK